VLSAAFKRKTKKPGQPGLKKFSFQNLFFTAGGGGGLIIGGSKAFPFQIISAIAPYSSSSPDYCI